MYVDDNTLLEMIREEDLNDFPLFEKVAKRVFHAGDNEVIRIFFNKMRFSFVSNSEGYRTKTLEKIGEIVGNYSLEQISSVCLDSLVGNYVALYVILKRIPIIDVDSARTVLDLVPRLERFKEICGFGFPYQEQVILQIDERVKNLSQEEINKLVYSCNSLFQIDFIKKSRTSIVSFLNVYNVVGKLEYSLRASLIAALLVGDQNQFFAVFEKFAELKVSSEVDIASNYYELWKCLEKLSIPVYFDVNNLRYNGVLYNDNFYFLKYRNFEGIDKIVFPFGQVPLSNVNRVYDSQARTFYTPRERYGRLPLNDVWSFQNIVKVNEPTLEAIAAITSMNEDEIDQRIRRILKDANETKHSPVEIVDVLTQFLHVNNVDDLRLAGFITKGESFGRVHLKDIGHQILKACLSPIKTVFLVHVAYIDDEAIRYFIEECESKQKNYCVVDRNELARLFVAYHVL